MRNPEGALGEVGSDVAAWARSHEACFEVAPLVELMQGRKAHVGFTISLYSKLPLGQGPGEARREDAGKVWRGLREILEVLVPGDGSGARVEVDAPRTAAFFRPENQMKPEIALTARVFHGADYLAEVTGDEREQLSAAMKRLTEMGLKLGHW